MLSAIASKTSELLQLVEVRQARPDEIDEKILRKADKMLDITGDSAPVKGSKFGYFGNIFDKLNSGSRISLIQVENLKVYANFYDGYVELVKRGIPSEKAAELIKNLIVRTLGELTTTGFRSGRTKEFSRADFIDGFDVGDIADTAISIASEEAVKEKPKKLVAKRPGKEATKPAVAGKIAVKPSEQKGKQAVKPAGKKAVKPGSSATSQQEEPTGEKVYGESAVAKIKQMRKAFADSGYRKNIKKIRFLDGVLKDAKAGRPISAKDRSRVFDHMAEYEAMGGNPNSEEAKAISEGALPVKTALKIIERDYRWGKPDTPEFLKDWHAAVEAINAPIVYFPDKQNPLALSKSIRRLASEQRKPENKMSIKDAVNTIRTIPNWKRDRDDYYALTKDKTVYWRKSLVTLNNELVKAFKSGERSIDSKLTDLILRLHQMAMRQGGIVKPTPASEEEIAKFKAKKQGFKARSARKLAKKPSMLSEIDKLVAKMKALTTAGMGPGDALYDELAAKLRDL